MASVCVIIRKDGIPQIRHSRGRDVTEPYPESLAALLATAGLYVSTLIPPSTVIALFASCLTIELWRAYKAHRLLCRPVAVILELPRRNRIRGSADS